MAAQEPQTSQQKDAAKKPPSTAKRDYIRAIEQQIQKEWEDKKIFDLDAGDEGTPKYLATFPYPYMNGRLHLGHTFTLTKAEFAASYQRLKGKRVIFPFGFHCTGMPIKACADKLKREMEEFGVPPVFPPEPEEPQEAEPAKAAEPDKKAPASKSGKKGSDNNNNNNQKGGAKKDDKKKKEDPLAFHAQKSKVKAKTGGIKYQWSIMESNGVPPEEIPKFADAEYWLKYFPPYCKADLQKMGAGIDWRRSFITTDTNPYYDSFVRWQFEHLKEMGKVLFGKRYTIYSPKDNGPCADHDRQTGEGVLPQEYVLIKLEVVEPFPEKLKSLEGKKKVYLVPGTLRPETMYGQTNCWVLPEGEYGAFEINDTDVFICTERSARNMAFQGLSKEFGKVSCLFKLTGMDIMGIPLRAPLSKYPVIYTLPMLSISPKKGTGIVTSVPSDAPDDYIWLEQWRNKPDFRAKYQIRDEMVLPYEIVPIIDIPEIGTVAAQTICQALKVKSPKDSELLAKAKEETYTKGFYTGTMIVGEHKGKPVKDAKPLIKEHLVATGQAVIYSEPADTVMSRSGDECVVCLTDQWFLNYGEESWRNTVKKHMTSNMDFYTQATKEKFDFALDWLTQWACSRTYGLGTRLPWDQQYLIDSLSDSTIYMAFYTVAHQLQGGVLDGSVPGPAQIKPEQMTRAVWDHIFLGKEYPADCGIPENTLRNLRKEFDYWYPVDLRVSGKDLITNHLVFFLYNHVAFWPESNCPRTIRGNGHILLNGEKMSKSTGNFLTLTDGIDEFTADGMRFALADAGDSLDDANFTTKTADSAILKLYTQIKWIEETLESIDKLQSGAPNTFFDKVFESLINKSIQETDIHYDRTNFREALKTGFFDLQTARDDYRFSVGATANMNRDLIMRFIEVQAILLAPITPHVSEYIWKLLKKEGSVRFAAWPVKGTIDEMILKQNSYLRNTVHKMRLKKDVYLKPRKPKKGQQPEAPPPPPTKATLSVARAYPAWMERILTLMSPIYSQIKLEKKSSEDRDSEAIIPNEKEVDKQVMAILREDAELAALMEKELEKDKEKQEKDKVELQKKKNEKAMEFVSTIKESFKQQGMSALDAKTPFDERELLEASANFIKRELKLEELIVQYEESGSARPGSPFTAFSS